MPAGTWSGKGTAKVQAAKTINDYAVVLAKHSRMDKALHQYEAAKHIYEELMSDETALSLTAQMDGKDASSKRGFDLSLINLNIASIKQTLTISVLRLLMGFSLALIAIEVFGLSGIAAGVILIQFSMPSAVFNYIFADRFNRDPDKVAAVILQSTLLSILTLPLLVAYALSRAGI